ncbi:hypothetical protein [Parendozoicomonas haliclonae]|uniref:Uncharacterized protein n=1 Tax=Parendozoicomonas haliclonae TaxID=1960125 RepID=A0A1X7AFM4_9GAMM|nr:hypothetical protein [Parendozoicomonas haliclonae]SMA36251.1 hypothetical protein EHSB41UT_00613 [Parendozoicomonas haliclonae]
MAGSIGDINSGLVGVSHTSGNDYQAMPSKSAIRPSVNTQAVNDVHISKALAADDSQNKLMQFIRGDRLSSYTPQDNRDLRTGIINLAEQQAPEGISAEEKQDLDKMVALLRQDAELDMMATMARNILIPA